MSPHHLLARALASSYIQGVVILSFRAVRIAALGPPPPPGQSEHFQSASIKANIEGSPRGAPLELDTFRLFEFMLRIR
jgi:hypothetical protein